MKKNISKRVKGEKLTREIHFNNLEEEKKDEDWDFVNNPIILKKKTVSPRKRETILNFFPDLIRNKKKIALVLSGGGAKGLAHVGLIEELEKYNVDIRFISGTSMGAIIGALYALEGNLKLVNKYIKYRTRDLVTLRDFSFTLKGIIKGRAIEDLLKDLYGNSTFEDTKIPLVINAVDIETGKEVIFRKGKIIDAVRASMSIPIVFEPKRIKGRMYVDGGVVNNVPYNHVPK
ncbi:MAG: patatin-like phospholipase family protein, partial [Nanoarchaeota archaeon]